MRRATSLCVFHLQTQGMLVSESNWSNSVQALPPRKVVLGGQQSGHNIWCACVRLISSSLRKQGQPTRLFHCRKSSTQWIVTKSVVSNFRFSCFPADTFTEVEKICSFVLDLYVWQTQLNVTSCQGTLKGWKKKFESLIRHMSLLSIWISPFKGAFGSAIRSFTWHRKVFSRGERTFTPQKGGKKTGKKEKRHLPHPETFLAKHFPADTNRDNLTSPGNVDISSTNVTMPLVSKFHWVSPLRLSSDPETAICAWRRSIMSNN